MRGRAYQSQTRSGFFINHLKGHYGLARSYWLHSVVFGWVLMYLAGLAVSQIAAAGSVRYVSMAVLAFEPFALLVWLWSTVGTFMSAIKQVFGGEGSRFWALAAILSLVLGCIGMIRQLSNLGPALTAHWEVAMGEQPGDSFTLTFRRDRHELVFAGGVNEGAAQALDQAVMSALGVVHTVVLDSPGGWMGEGRRMAEVIRTHNLNTHVERDCMSACTLALLAGHERTADDRARVGFHQARAIGQDRQRATSRHPPGRSRREEEALYVQAGVSAAFAHQVVNVPFSQMWVPTRQELLDAQVLTR